jgi:membrane fusion protein (multidrug efflux system)
MASKILYTTVAVVGIAAASGAARWYQNKPAAKADGAASAASAPQPGANAAGAPRAAAVEVARVEIMRLSDDTQAVGSLRSRQGVVLRPEVSGRITQLNFRDGDRVRKGQLLVQFDDQLQAAQLKQSLAELSIATANHKRNQELLAQKFVSQRSVDETAANLEVAQAKVALAQATVDRLKVKAPFDGITGIRQVNPGDYLKDGADIVNIEDIDAVYVDFRLPERFQAKVRKGQRAQVDLDALPGRRFTAVIQAVDPLLDANGRSVGVRACIDNRQLQLRPGMFARVTPVFGERDNAKVVPEEAIVPQGQKVYVIKVVDGPEAGSKVSQRVEVKVGIRRPGKVEITEGIGEGDTVVIAGQQRIQKDGSPVRILDLQRGRAESGPAAAASAPASGRAPDAAAATTTAASAPAVAASAPVQASAMAGVAPPPSLPARLAAAPKAAEGPNPCLVDPVAGPSGKGEDRQGTERKGDERKGGARGAPGRS